MSAFIAPKGLKAKPFAYENFMGIDAMRDKAAMENQEAQHLLTVKDGFCDYMGAIVKAPGVRPRSTSKERTIKHLNFYGRDLAVWAEFSGGGTTIKSEAGHELTEVWSRNANPASTVFGGNVYFASRGEQMYRYNGALFEAIKSGTNPKPAYLCTTQRRLAIAGVPGYDTRVLISRADDADRFPDDELKTESSVLKASDIDIRNFIGTSDKIRGIGAFEQNRLAVFTDDLTLVYRLHPDYTQWEIDDKANITVGTISHNTICRAGVDLLFCSRSGVHSIKRSVDNGVAIYSIPLSEKVAYLYRRLVKRVSDPELINAWFDQDNGQYHIYFPETENLCSSLTMTVPPNNDGEIKWSTGAHLNARCGRGLSGVYLLGTAGGIWQRYNPEDDAEYAPELVVQTPIFWHGAINDIKESTHLIMQATGHGEITVEAFDERGQQLSAIKFDVDDEAADDNFPDVPLSRQYERKFEHRYRGVQFRITARGNRLLKITGFAVMIRG
jgi:hypothetical protein